MVERIPITDVWPVVEGGRYPVKAVAGETLRVGATVFREGHDALGAAVVLKGPRGRPQPPIPLWETDEPDHFAGWVTPGKPGAWTFRIESWSDPYASWRHAATIKLEAGIDVDLMLAEGILVVRRAAAGMPTRSAARRRLLAAADQATDESASVGARFWALTGPDVEAALREYPLRDLLSTTEAFPLQVDRERALVGSWYEFFPRSEGAHRDPETGEWRSGTFETAARRLDAVAAMGFDVVYLPPIHPIGEVNRKGRNNALTAQPGEPGSPWAIGSRLGGHDAVHPDLGTMDDFDAFVARAGELGLEVALDLALQCAPDHPWVTSHPEWFTSLADGTIAYAENPPKKYQDIYPLNFDNDPAGITKEVLRLIKLWAGHGVRIFRVDNPHTKPLSFWETVLAKVRATDPDIVFLSEALTRPAMMRGLGMVGFHQSYTYFTWRTGRDELAAYLMELSHDTSSVLRPNLFVNTPDILSEYLQYGGPAAFKIRAAVAATGAPSWGVYAGFDLFEHVALRQGSEEYLNSEKYEYRPRDWDRALAEGRSLAPYVARLNDIRRRHPALRRLRNLTVHPTDDDSVLCFSKREGDDVVIVVVNLDPHAARETLVHLTMPALGMEWYDTFLVDDELTGQTWRWGDRAYVRLDPGWEPAHILSVRREPS